MTSSTYIAILAGVAIGQMAQQILKFFRDWASERRKEIAERRKVVLDATIMLITTKQTTGKDYYAGDVSKLYTRLAYLIENDGAGTTCRLWRAGRRSLRPASTPGPRA